MNDDQLDIDKMVNSGELDGVGNADLLYDDEPKPEPDEVPRPALGLVVPEEPEPPKVDMNVASTYVLAILKERPTAWLTLRIQLARKLGNEQVVKDVLAWLEQRGKIEPFQNFKNQPAYRMATGAPKAKPAPKPAVAAAASRPPSPPRAAAAPAAVAASEPAPRRPPPLARSARMAQQEWISTADAAKLLGGKSTGYVAKLAQTGKIKAKKDDKHEGGGRVPWVYLRSSVLAYQPNLLGGETPPPKATKSKAKPVARKAAKKTIADVAKKHANGTGHANGELEPVRWVIKGYQIGRLTKEQAAEQLVDVLTEEALEQLAEVLG